MLEAIPVGGCIAQCGSPGQLPGELSRGAKTSLLLLRYEGHCDCWSGMRAATSKQVSIDTFGALGGVMIVSQGVTVKSPITG